MKFAGAKVSPAAMNRTALRSERAAMVLGRKPAAPICSASSATLRGAVPDSSPTGLRPLTSMVSVSPSSPFIPGISKSSSTRSNGPFCRIRVSAPPRSSAVWT